MSPYHIFRDWTDEAHKLFPRHTEHLAVATDGFQPFYGSWTPKHIKNGGLDGRRAVVLINSDGSSGISVVMRRQIETSGSTWTLAASFEQIETHRSRRLDSLAAWDIAAAAALILAVDAERMLRRSAETASFPKIDVRIRGEQSRHAFHISWLVRGILEHRNVRIEPVGWTGDSVTILWDDDTNSPTS